MAKAKKFGTFAGVFTPSVLTILGVIMYLRLGWVVGEAGLFQAIMIVLVAHVISISTGLSVSSISTDKRVKAGGIYYILSRSLGLPIGGSIGITLFIGTALSIALYVIGFSESFLDFLQFGSGFQVNEQTFAILKEAEITESLLNEVAQLKSQVFNTSGEFLEAIQKQVGTIDEAIGEKIIATSKGITVNDLRIAGTITLLAVATIAFISTSFALKTQFFILAAIGISLIAIFFGDTSAYAPKEFTWSAPGDGASFIVIFGIFFPAVTGFTAGVAMSGDLRDPKRTIPKGTILAIAVGLIVYLALTFFIAFKIDSATLRSNYNILKEIALFSPLFVLAGIWGATISSALGGILGAPRILQALSYDKVTPKIFGKGVGKNNEPRNALILTILIAEVGILIGELNAIAEVVSMFYLAAYGFINLSSTLESWASPDYRPQFKIPKIISIIGTVSTFVVMILLNLPAMIIAFIIIIAIFFYLTRKQISLDGDVWQGVWTSLIRRGLHNIVKHERQERNWRPNIILFSGGQSRSYLVNLGKNLIGNLGFLSNFELIEKRTEDIIFPKPQQSATEEGENSVGVFLRKQECTNIYQGMEEIAQTYGFSGVDPNAVLLGWGKQTNEPTKFVQTLRKMIQLDYNLIILDYKKDLGFGNKERIDIWWHNVEHNRTLSLNLLKFMMVSTDWRKAEARILVVNEDNSIKNRIYKNVNKLLEEFRIDAKVKVINNEIQKKSFQEIMHEESANSDLVLVGMRDLDADDEIFFIERTNILLNSIRCSVVLIKESSYFADSLGSQNSPLWRDLNISFKKTLPELPKSGIKLVPDQLPKDEILSVYLTNISQKTETILEEYLEKYIQKSYAVYKELVNSLKEIIGKNFTQLKDILSKIGEESSENQVEIIFTLYLHFCDEIKEILNAFVELQLPNEQENMKDNIQWIYAEFIKVISENPPPKKQAKVLKYYVKSKGQELLFTIFSNLESEIMVYNTQIQKIIHIVSNSFEKVESSSLLGKIDDNFSLDNEKTKAINLIENLIEAENTQIVEVRNATYGHLKNYFSEISKEFEYISTNNKFSQKYVLNKEDKNRKKIIDEIPDYWGNNQNLIVNNTIVEIELLIFQKHFSHLVRVIDNKCLNLIEKNGLSPLNVFLEYLESHDLNEIKQYIDIIKQEIKEEHEQNFEKITSQFVDGIKTTIDKFPKEIQIISEESLESLQSNDLLIEADASTLSFRRLIDYIVQTKFTEPFLKFTKNLPLQLEQANSRVQDVVRLITFSINDEEESEEAKLEVSKAGQQQIVKEKERILAFKHELKKQVKLHLDKTLAEFNVYNLNKSASNLSVNIRARGSKKALSSVGRLKYSLQENSQKQLTRLWYQKSNSIILNHQKKLKEGLSKEDIHVSYLIQMVENLSPNPSILEQLPPFYAQLFTRKQNIGNSFWFGRTKEITQAKKALTRLKQGNEGAILVLGDPDAGKTAFCEYFAEENFHPQNIFHLNPIKGGSKERKSFKRTLQKATGVQGGYETIFDELGEESALIINDIELWWERSESGMAVIQEIFDLINEYGDTTCFILNCNLHAWKFINSLEDFSGYCLETIICQPFSAKELKEIILFRHRSSPITFHYKGTDEKDMNEWKYAKLFAKYFDYSQGNIGQALSAWICNIEHIENEVLEIHAPKKQNINALKNLSIDWNLFLLQFVLHKQLTKKRLERIMGLSRPIIEKKIKVLLRTGIITNEGGVLKIKRQIFMPLLKHYRAQKIL